MNRSAEQDMENDSMPKLTLTYFDFDGGRGEPARLALSIAGIPFEDHRVTSDAWPSLKPQMPYGALPVLEVDGHPLSQSNAISRYIGKLANLYPADAWQAALCDEVMDAIEDIGQQIVATFPIQNAAEKKAAREKLASGPIPLYLARLHSQLEQRGEYFADGRLTMADLRVFVWIRHLRSGALDHVPADLVDRTGPALVRHAERVSGHPAISAYYTRRRSAQGK
jgi:prostaglandin-H2 D-isomerase / glutathione transferase